MIRWDLSPLPEVPRYGPLNYLLFFMRGSLMTLVIMGFLIPLLALRAAELPWGRNRISPYMTQMACRLCLRIVGITLHRKGSPMKEAGAIVSNHSSWLDIFVSNSLQNIVFVSKEEVADWIGVGFLAKATGVLFVKRERREALRQRDEFVRRLARGDRLLFFPEGTSTDGLRVLSFKTTLFAALFAESLAGKVYVQPMTIRYRPAPGQHPAFYGFWGDMEFTVSLFKVLATPRNGDVDLTFHDAVRISDFADRKELAHHCEMKVRAGLESRDTPAKS